MKMLTLNTHSLREENYEKKLETFMGFILRERPDLIALQEVNQSAKGGIAGDSCGRIDIIGRDTPLRVDNHGLRITRCLQDSGIRCSWAWLPIKCGYGRYDEGVAIISLCGEISATDVYTVSRADNYDNWRTRKILGIRVEDRREWFYTVHMGWWQDAQEPFYDQWQRLTRHLEPFLPDNRIWLMGDFNAPAHVRNQGYDMILESGWKDTYQLAGSRDKGLTTAGAIDGWRETSAEAGKAEGMRIDYIWCSKDVPVRYSRTIFDGRNEPMISDHFGVMIETGEVDGLWADRGI